MEKKSQYYWFNICLFILGFVQFVDSETWGTCLLKPTINSGWTSMIAQDARHSQISLEHGFGEWPAYVDIQIKPANQSGSNAPFVFPGIGSAQRDDDENIPYGGIVYIYDKTRVTLFAPNKNDGPAPGSAIYTGDNLWQGPNKQNEAAVEVRMRAWKAKDFPKPDFVSNWTKITSGKNTGSYLKIPHGLNREPQFVTVQIKLGHTEFISDGIGSDTRLDGASTNTKWGGVIHAYDNTMVKIWAPSSLGGGIFSATDGWGNNDASQFYTEGEVRVRVWAKLSSSKFARGVTRVGIQNLNTTTANLPFAISQTNDLFKVTLKAINAPNNGSHFLASGAAQNIKPNVHFGGLVYAYSDYHLRYWYPLLTQIGSTGNGYLIYLNNEWGDGNSYQLSTTVDLESNTWKVYPTCPPITTTASIPHHPDRPLHTAPSWFLKYSFKAANTNGVTTIKTNRQTNPSRHISQNMPHVTGVTIAATKNGTMYDQKPSTETAGISTTVIAVIVVVLLLLILAAVAGVSAFFILKKKKQQKEKVEPEGNEQDKENTDEKKLENSVKSTVSIKSATRTQIEENMA